MNSQKKMCFWRLSFDYLTTNTCPCFIWSAIIITYFKNNKTNYCIKIISIIIIIHIMTLYIILVFWLFSKKKLNTCLLSVYPVFCIAHIVKQKKTYFLFLLGISHCWMVINPWLLTMYRCVNDISQKTGHEQRNKSSY